MNVQGMDFRVKCTAVVLAFGISLGCIQKQGNSNVKENQGAQTAPELKGGGAFSPRVIYGNDDRLEYFQVVGTPLAEIADSTVALMKPDALNSSGNSTSITGPTFGTSYNLCTSERFREEATPAFCSGFLVAPNIVVTAGHCVTDSTDCSETRFVFGFRLNSAGQQPLSVPTSEVYSCAEVLKTQHPATDADFAVIRLNRSVPNHKPLSLRSEGSVSPGDNLIVIGHPVGLPLKVAGGAKVRSNSSPGFFVANLDTYGGNSGSAVLNAQTLKVEGVLVRGETDFSDSGSCTVSNRCSDSSCRGEDVTRIASVVPFIPKTTDPGTTPGADDAVYTSTGTLGIPDNKPAGVKSVIKADQAPAGRKVQISIEIRHTYVGDLIVKVGAPDGSSLVLSKNQGGSQHDLVGTFDAASLSQVKNAGNWTLSIADTAAVDVGNLVKWSVKFSK